MVLCEEKQHDFRNAIMALEGWMRQLRNENKITPHDKDIGMFYLRKMTLCSRLDSTMKESDKCQGS